MDDFNESLHIIESVVRQYHEQVARDGGEPATSDDLRRELHGAKWMLTALKGTQFKYRVLADVRRHGLRIQHIGERIDGGYLGTDGDADI